MKSKKDEVIKTIFKKRKEKMLSMETPKDTLTHHVSSSTFDGFNNSHFHHHNLSQFENPINQISITNIGAIVNTDNQQHSNSISKVLKDKKYRKFAAERTQTPPPPTTMMRMVNTQNSNEKSLQNSSSFISKKQTAYINPKNPDETAYVPSSVTSNKIQSSVQNNKKVNIKLNNFVKTSNKQENNNLLQSISERQKRPQSSNDNISIMSSFSNNTNSIPQTMNNTVNNHHQSSKSQMQYVQNFQLNKNINVKIQQATFLQHQYTFNAHNNTISDLSCDDFNSGILYSSSYDYSVKVWNLTNEGRSLSYEAQFSPFSNDSQHGNRPPSSYSTNNFGSASMIQPIKKFDSKQRQRVNSLVHLGVFGVLAAAGNDKLIKLYTTKFSQNKLEHQHTIKGGHAGVINNLAKVENDMIASSCSDGYIRIFNLSHQNYQEPSLILEQLDSSPELINVLNKNCLLSTGSDGGIRLWDIRQPEAPVQTYHKFHYDKINTIDNLSGYVFASASDDSNINMWDIRMSKMLKQIRFENDHVGCIKFIKQNYLIASHANQLTLLSIRDNFTTRQTFAQNDIEDRFSIQSTLEDTGVQNSTHRTKAIAFSEKDRKLYVAGFDKKIQVWNINLVL
ncbi:wd40 repeat-containing protein [Stylonychia lemnae]|uniref:Wd40 repeat-containing protein n=1 Tax=Stylonychia lemnae TaxID=5949 RepID=A0A078ASW6_STYLE|nr:wd40 repeat-containing protein [Stylonychia lemnae]|eukprot:CDW85560.1 wd40 repeat-containing protein [Stylonychia lemnae]